MSYMKDVCISIMELLERNVDEGDIMKILNVTAKDIANVKEMMVDFS